MHALYLFQLLSTMQQTRVKQHHDEINFSINLETAAVLFSIYVGSNNTNV